MRRIRVLAALLLAIGAATAVAAQRYRLPEGPQVPPRFPPARFSDGAFTHCKMMYTSVRGEANGIGWATDYPYAGINLMTRVARADQDADQPGQRTATRTTGSCASPTTRCSTARSRWPPTSARWGSPTTRSTRLREYLLKGGFLWVDDFWGTRAWQQWSAQIRRVLPEYPIVDVPADHADPPHDVQRRRDPAGHQHQLLARAAAATTSERGVGQPARRTSG